MHPKQIEIKDYTYDLPEERIARFPLENRDESKLLIFKNGTINQTIYKNIGEKLPANSLLVFNNTKVVEARLMFSNANGAAIEIFCLEPDELYKDITKAMLMHKKVLWKCLIGNAKKFKEETISLTVKNDNHNFVLSAKKIEKRNDYFLIEFTWNAAISFADVLHAAGKIPLPPYLKREVTEQDKTTYQTTYAMHDGSVAAPTAGLHFTPAIFKNFEKKNIHTAFVTLHVGAGTFMPVKAQTMEAHDMHYEYIDVHIETIETILNKVNDGIIAVGTTSLRTIESIYWIGVKLMYDVQCKMCDVKTRNEKRETIVLNQWDCYELPQNISIQDSLQALIDWMKENKMKSLIAQTQIIIAPGYTLKVAKGLITNFHQPGSTLILLVAAVVGKHWKEIYSYALKNEFRFLSYGDGSLLWA